MHDNHHVGVGDARHLCFVGLVKRRKKSELANLQIFDITQVILVRKKALAKILCQSPNELVHMFVFTTHPFHKLIFQPLFFVGERTFSLILLELQVVKRKTSFFNLLSCLNVKTSGSNGSNNR
jgi:hypothetical protein